MKRHGKGSGLIWICPFCDGRAATIPSLRRRLAKRTVNVIWQAARQSDREGVTCPACQHTMRDVEVPVPDGYQVLDVCLKCFCVWFDPGEYDVMPRKPAADPVREPEDPRVAEAVGRFQLEHRKTVERHRASEAAGLPSGPDSPWKWAAGLIGLPVRMDEHPTTRRPWVTWGLVVAIATLSAAAFGDLERMVEQFGFLPADPFRLGGLTPLTSFFLHADWLHLLGNAYFLLLVGPHVEDVVGIGRFLALLGLATVVGAIVFSMAPGDPTMPAIGASGGISGVMAYHALRCPRMRIGILVYFYWWIRLPAVVWFILWVGMQVFGALLRADNVAYTAHLGGAVVGFAFWSIDRRREAA